MSGGRQHPGNSSQWYTQSEQAEGPTQERLHLLRLQDLWKKSQLRVCKDQGLHQQSLKPRDLSGTCGNNISLQEGMAGEKEEAAIQPRQPKHSDQAHPQCPRKWWATKDSEWLATSEELERGTKADPSWPSYRSPCPGGRGVICGGSLGLQNRVRGTEPCLQSIVPSVLPQVSPVPQVRDADQLDDIDPYLTKKYKEEHEEAERVVGPVERGRSGVTRGLGTHSSAFLTWSDISPP